MTASKKDRPAATLSSSAATPSNAAGSPAVHADGFAVDEQIRLRAFELYRERGGIVGDDVGDWLQAEREYLELSRTSPGASRAGQRTADLTLPASQS